MSLLSYCLNLESLCHGGIAYYYDDNSLLLIATLTERSSASAVQAVCNGLSMSVAQSTAVQS